MVDEELIGREPLFVSNGRDHVEPGGLLLRDRVPQGAGRNRLALLVAGYVIQNPVLFLAIGFRGPASQYSLDIGLYDCVQIVHGLCRPAPPSFHGSRMISARALHNSACIHRRNLRPLGMDDLFTFVKNGVAERRGKWPELAQASGVSYSWLSKFGAGRVPNPNMRTLNKVASVLRGADRPQ